MKNKVFYIIAAFSFIFITSCGGNRQAGEISPSEMEVVLQEFTESRINQYLYSTENPRDNLSVLMMVLNKHNFNYNVFSEKLKKENPELYGKLVGKQEKL